MTEEIISLAKDKSRNIGRLDELDQTRENVREYIDRVLPTENSNTLRAKRADYNHYKSFCDNNDHVQFSQDFAEAKDVIFNYITYMITSELSKSTIRRRLSTISGMFAMLELKNPLKDSKNVIDFIRNSLRDLPAPKQMAPVRHSNIKQLAPISADSSIIEIRDAMLMYLGIYTLCRASELLALKVEDIDFEVGTAFIARAKNDQEGKGRYANLSPKTLDLIHLYLDKTGIKEGLFIRRIFKSGKVGEPLKYIGYTKIIKKVANKMGIAVKVNTHSLRIGSAVSMAEKGVSLTEITLAGGWKNSTMPVHYTRQANAKLTGTAHFKD